MILSDVSIGFDPVFRVAASIGRWAACQFHASIGIDANDTDIGRQDCEMVGLDIDNFSLGQDVCGNGVGTLDTYSHYEVGYGFDEGSETISQIMGNYGL